MKTNRRLSRWQIIAIAAILLSAGELAFAIEPLPDSLFQAARSAAWDGDSAKLRSLLYDNTTSRPSLSQLNTLLQIASYTSHSSISITLLDSGADFNFRGWRGATVLQYASKQENTEPLFFELLRRGADPFARDSAGTTALHYVATGGSEKMFQALISRGLDVNIRDSASQTPLHFAAVSNNSIGARYLLGAGAEINAEDINGLTPIVRAWQVRVSGPMYMEGPDFYDREGTKTWGAPDVFYTLLEAGASTSGIDWKANHTLLRLAEYDNTAGLVFALKQGASLVFPDSVTTPLHIAARFDCSQIAAFILGYTGSPDAKNEIDETPLIVACRYGAIKCAKLLIEAGADVSYQPSPKPVISDGGLREWIGGHRAIEYLPPLLWSYKNNHSAISVLLIKKGADPNAIPPNWDPLIFTAATRQDAAMIDALIEHGVDVNAQSIHHSDFPAGGYNYTALEQTVRAGNLFLAKKLIHAGASLSLHSKDGYYDKQSGLPLLHRMAAVGNMEALHWLIAEGFDPNGKDDAGQTAAFQATERNDIGMLEALDSAGTDFKLLNNNSESILYTAARSGSEEALLFALQQNLDPNAHNTTGLTPLCAVGQFKPAATDSNSVNAWMVKVRRMAEYLIGAGVDATGLRGGANVFNYAISIGHPTLARIALEHGADPFAVDKDGNTYLHRFANAFGSGWAAALLIEFGADPNARNNAGYTPIFVAAAQENYYSMADSSFFRALAQGGANLEVRDQAGRTALALVVSSTHEDIAKVLLESGANPDPEDSHGLTPLAYSTNWRDVLCAQVLLEFGANPNRCTPKPFHRPYLGSAALDSYFDIVRVFLAHGADPNLTDDSLNTPLHLAACSHYPNEGGWCIEALLAAGANPRLKNIQGDTPFDIARKRGIPSNAALLEKAMRKK